MSDGAFCHYCHRSVCQCWTDSSPRLKKLVENLSWVSPGEWGVYGGPNAMEESHFIGTDSNTEPHMRVVPYQDKIAEALEPYHQRWKSNRDFIISAKKDVPWLLEMIRMIMDVGCQNSPPPSPRCNNCINCFVLEKLENGN